MCLVSLSEFGNEFQSRLGDDTEKQLAPMTVRERGRSCEMASKSIKGRAMSCITGFIENSKIIKLIQCVTEANARNIEQ